MNQILENPSSAETRFTPSAPANATVSEKGRVLLLEDDVSFRRIITEFLTERGHTVVAVNNGAEGVREVLAADFAMILCDLMMPSVPGDTFYRTVEQVRPHLISRFVFMTGHGNDQKTKDFIQSIAGCLIQKPFRLEMLPDLMVFAGVRSDYVSVIDSDSPGGRVAPPLEEDEVVTEAPKPIPTVQADLAQRQIEESDIPPQPAAPPANPLPRKAAALGIKRVLLLDDDSSFNDIIRDFLTETGFTVVAVRSGGDGVREVLAGDFALVLCDIMMPGLPGDMFYRAVERIRPELCERFIFMSGHRGDEHTCEFLKQANCSMLRKPFPLQDLLDAITSTEARQGLPRTSAAVPAAPVAPPARPPASAVQAPAPVHRPESRVVAEVPVLLPSVVSPPYRYRVDSRQAEPDSSESATTQAYVFAGLALAIVLVVNLGFRGPGARDRATAASAERVALKTEWERVSAHQGNPGEARQEYDTLQWQLKRLADEKSSGWTETLRFISNVGAPGIALYSIVAHGIEGSDGSARILLQGYASGPQPRAMAESFYNSLRLEAERKIAGTVATELDRIVDEPATPSTPLDRRRARFHINLNVRLNKPQFQESEAAK